jgi:hypothetical protein
MVFPYVINVLLIPISSVSGKAARVPSCTTTILLFIFDSDSDSFQSGFGINCEGCGACHALALRQATDNLDTIFEPPSRFNLARFEDTLGNLDKNLLFKP